MAIRHEALAQTDFSALTTGKRITPVKPGHILRDDFMKPLGLTANALRVPANRITGILNGSRQTRRCGWRATSGPTRKAG